MNVASRDILSLGSGRVGLTLDPGFGARVLTLTDRAVGRQWLLEGPRRCEAGEDAVYLNAASRGWDECFPTILPCHHAAWGGRLRDHGTLWGRAWDVVDATADRVLARHDAEGVRFGRDIAVADKSLTASYTLTSSRDRAVPYMWSQHCVLAVRPGDKIRLCGHDRMMAGSESFAWPRFNARDLSHVGTPDEGFALKAYTLTTGRASAEVHGQTGGIRFDWDSAALPALGLWLDYGGWPADGPLHQVALEPTTAAADDLVAAEAMGQARLLEPGTTHEWSVTLTLLDADEGPRP